MEPCQPWHAGQPWRGFNAKPQCCWLACQTARGPVSALAFTLSRQSPNFTGSLSDAQYRHILRTATGRYGTTLHYAQATLDGLRHVGIEDHSLRHLLQRFGPGADPV